MSVNASPTYGRLVWNQFKRQRAACLGLAAIVALLLLALAAPLLAGNRPLVLEQDGELSFPAFSNDPKLKFMDYAALRDDPPKESWVWMPLLVHYGPDETNLFEIREAPGKKHWLGTDDVGRDVLSRLSWGSRISLSVGFVAVGLYVSIGLILGALAGFYGGWVDSVISRCIEVMICLPGLMFIIMVIAFMGPGLFNVMVVIGLIGWPSIARLARAEFLRLRNLDYVDAVRALGCSPARIIFRHVLPNALAPVLVAATFGVASAILLESTLSFLGFGVPEPQPTWGGLLANGRSYVSSWWLTVFPGGVIFVTILAYNVVGEGLRNAIDARLKS